MDIKKELTGIHESVRKLSDMFSEIAVSKVEQKTTNKILEEILADNIRTKEKVDRALIEKAEIVVLSRQEHMRFDKDIHEAHNEIREIQETLNGYAYYGKELQQIKEDLQEIRNAQAKELEVFSAEREDSSKFRETVTTYAKFGALAITALTVVTPWMWNGMSYLYKLLAHVPIQ